MKTVQRKLLLLFGCVLAVAAVAAPAASAETVTELQNAASGDACSVIWLNCDSDATAGHLEIRYPNKQMVTYCDGGTATVNFGAEGTVVLSDVVYGYNGNCSSYYWLQSCVSDAEGQIEGSLAAGYEFEVDMCIESLGGKSWVTVPFEVEVDEEGRLVGLTQQKDAAFKSGLILSNATFDLDGTVRAVETEI